MERASRRRTASRLLRLRFGAHRGCLGGAAGLPSELHLETTVIVLLPPSPVLPLPSGVSVAAGVVGDGQPGSSWAGEWNAAFHGNGANPTDHPWDHTFRVYFFMLLLRVVVIMH